MVFVSKILTKGFQNSLQQQQKTFKREYHSWCFWPYPYHQPSSEEEVGHLPQCFSQSPQLLSQVLLLLPLLLHSLFGRDAYCLVFSCAFNSAGGRPTGFSRHIQGSSTFALDVCLYVHVSVSRSTLARITRSLMSISWSFAWVNAWRELTHWKDYTLS